MERTLTAEMFARFQASGKDVADVSENLGLEEATPGRQYMGGLVLQDMGEGTPGGRYWTVLERSEYQSDDLAEIEQALAEYALLEGTFEGDADND